MIGPVSGTGRAMMASLQQAIQKGMPPDQAVQYVKSMATQGVAPMTDLYAMVNQFERLKQQQVKPPQTPPTIRDQLNIMDQQQQMQGGIAGMQASPPAPEPMDRGLGAIDAGRMQYPQFAGGGIVAFSNGGTTDIDFSEMSDEQLAMLEQGTDVALARRAFKERLNRSGYTSPKELFGKYVEAVKAGIPTGPAIRFDMSGGAPEYMKDAQGRIRTPGMGGPVAYSLTEGVVPVNRPAATPAVTPSQSAASTGTAITPYSSPQDAGAAFDRALAIAQQNTRQDTTPARTGVGVATTGGRGRSGDPFTKLIGEVEGRKFEEIADTFSPEEKKRIEKALSGLGTEKQDAVRMALARAGFSMAAAASRRGRERTTTLGALAEGALGGMQQYSAVQKELRQTEKDLNKEMADLRKYQDQVARGERTAKRDFEEKKQDRIADLTARRESALLTREEIASRERIAGMQYGEDSGQNAYRRSALTISGLEPMLKAAQERLNAISTIPPAGMKVGTPEHKALIAAAQREVDSLKAELRAAFGGGSGSAVPTTTFSNIVDYSSLK